MYTIPTIVLCVVTFLVGMAAGSFVEQIMKKNKPAPPTSPPPEDQIAGEGDTRVFTAWRTSENQAWLEMDGTPLREKGDFQPEQRQRLLDYIIALRPWLETNRPSVPEPVSPPPPPAAPEPVSPVPPPAAPASAPAVTPIQPVSLQDTAAPDSQETPSEPVMDSMIRQIDRILQSSLADGPYKERGIRLVEGPGGVVLVMDGLNRYEGIDAVPDPEIRDIIHRAVSEWEKGTG